MSLLAFLLLFPIDGRASCLALLSVMAVPPRNAVRAEVISKEWPVTCGLPLCRGIDDKEEIQVPRPTMTNSDSWMAQSQYTDIEIGLWPVK
jgi:hypothetical protein